MSIIEHIIRCIAPHTCLQCHIVGSLLCAQCQSAQPLDTQSCYICRRPSPGGLTCCPGSALTTVRAVAPYTRHAKQLVWQLKFNRARDAAHTIAIMCDARSDTVPSTIITHVPTANSRVRIRGYDQAYLIAHEYAQLAGAHHTTLLARTSEVRQVGADARLRRAQLQSAFRVTRPNSVQNAKILLIDDVITTGSSLEACATTLLQAGAKEIHALVFARA